MDKRLRTTYPVLKYTFFELLQPIMIPTISHSRIQISYSNRVIQHPVFKRGREPQAEGYSFWNKRLGSLLAIVNVVFCEAKRT